MNKGEPCRTPNGSNSNNEYLVNPTGQNNNNNANNSNGVAPDYRNSPIQVDTQVLKAEQSCKEGSSCPVRYRRKADADAGRALVPAEPTSPLWEVDAVNGIPFDYADLIEAVRECKQNVMWKDSVAGFVKNRLINCTRILNELHGGTYQLSHYACFKIYEPKERDIVATSIRDRVVQRALCDTYLYNALTHGFIYDNWACQINKGTTACRKRFKELLQIHYRKHGTEGYVLNVDIKNYFGSTRHDVAKAAVAKKVKNPWVRGYVFMLIDSFHGITGDRMGIGLGSQISQLIQLAVLDDLDHIIKDRLGIRCYIRYMDDMKIIHRDKEKLKEIREVIRRYLQERGLKLSDRKTFIAPLTNSIRFLGFRYRLTETGFVVQRLEDRKIAKERKKLVAQMKILPIWRVDEGYTAWKANVKQGTTYALIQRMNSFYYYHRRHHVS